MISPHPITLGKDSKNNGIANEMQERKDQQDQENLHISDKG